MQQQAAVTVKARVFARTHTHRPLAPHAWRIKIHCGAAVVHAIGMNTAYDLCIAPWPTALDRCADALWCLVPNECDHDACRMSPSTRARSFREYTHGRGDEKCMHF